MIYDIQKASILKRISAWLLDFILICILATGFMFLLSWITGLDNYSEQWQQTAEKWANEYNVDFNITEEQYNELTQDEQNNWDEAYNKLEEELSENKSRSMTLSLMLLCLTLGLLLSFVILNFVLPLVFKNGRTIGMKVFNLGVVFHNGVRINTFALFVRSILGQYTLETMVPVFIVLMMLLGLPVGVVGLVVLGGLAILQLVLVIATKNRTLVHDIISSTVVVDMALQMIFDNYDELVSYKEQLAQEAAEKSKY